MSRIVKEIVWDEPMPPCDFCTMQGARPVRDGIYDHPTTSRVWANSCTTHMRQHAPKHCRVTKRVRSVIAKPPGEVLL